MVSDNMPELIRLLERMKKSDSFDVRKNMYYRAKDLWVDSGHEYEADTSKTINHILANMQNLLMEMGKFLEKNMDEYNKALEAFNKGCETIIETLLAH